MPPQTSSPSDEFPSLEHLSVVFRSMSEGVVVQRADGTIAMANPAAARILGLGEDELLGRTSADPRWRAVREDGSPFPGDEHPAMVTLRTGRPCRDVVMGIDAPAHAERRWIRVNSDLVPRTGEVEPGMAVVTTIADITDSVRQALEVRRQRDFTEAIIAAMPDGLFVVGPDRRLVRVNDRFCALTGFPREQLEGAAPPYPWWPPGSEPARQQRLREFAPPDDQPFRMEVATARGDIIPVEVTQTATFDESGAPELAVITVRDVSLRDAGDRALLDSEERYRAAIAATRDGMITLGADGRVRSCNAASAAILGMPQGRIIGSGPGDLGLTVVDADGVEVPPERRLVVTALRTGRAVPPTLSGITPPGGQRRWVLESCEPLGSQAPHGRPAEVLLTLTDVTALRDAEAALRASEQRYRALFGYSSDAVVRLDPAGHVLAASPSVWRVLRFDPNDLPAEPFPHIHPDDRDGAMRDFGRMVAGEVDVRMRIRMQRGDGIWIWVDVTGGPVYDDEGNLLEIQHSLRDVTDQVVREQDDTALRRIAEVVAAGAEAPVVYGTLARELAAVAQADVVAVVRFDGPRGLCVGYWRTGEPQDRELPWREMDLTSGDTAAAGVWATGRPASVRSAPRGAGGVVGLGRVPLVGAAMAVPVQVDGTTWGCLSAGADADSLTPTSLERMTRFADLAGIAIASIRERDRLRQAAGIDALTGLRNRRSFHRRLDEQFAAARESGAALSLAVLDIDGFGEFERTHEPGAGDALLRHLAARLLAAARPEDTVARVGDDEFAWMMPGVCRMEAGRRAAAFVAGAAGGTDSTAPSTSAGVGDASGAAGAADLFRDAKAQLRAAKLNRRLPPPAPLS